MSRFTLAQVIEALEQSWSAETRYPGVKWDRKNPARGQCAVSAMIVQDYFGGDLKRYSVLLDKTEEKHFVNAINDEVIVDVTRSQYPQGIVMNEYLFTPSEYNSVREKLEADEDTLLRYSVLKSKVAKILQEDSL